MWQFPWRYKESIAVVGGVVIVGLMLQWLTGAFDFSLLQWPVNAVVGSICILLLLLLALKRKSSFYQWFSGVPMAVTLISALTIFGIIMGLTPQAAYPVRGGDWVSRLGLTHMTSSWPFVLLYMLTLLSLGALIIRRLFSFRIRDYAFYLNHIGLWLLLFAAGMGASDIKRYVMYVQEGKTEWRVFNNQQEALELPIAIELIDFNLEEYPPQLVLVNKHTGDIKPVENPEEFREPDADHFVTMTRPEPKRFVSDIRVYTSDGQEAHTLLEVNKPFRTGHWMIYQYGYDNEAGSYSSYSSFELVYDPWVAPVYVGIILLAAGSICMLWSGNRRKEVDDDLG